MVPENLSNGNLGHLGAGLMAVNHLRVGAQHEAEEERLERAVAQQAGLGVSFDIHSPFH